MGVSLTQKRVGKGAPSLLPEPEPPAPPPNGGRGLAGHHGTSW
jgi:hypothetical protein